MFSLSTLAEEEERTERRRVAGDRWLRVGAPAVVALVFIAVLLVEGGAPRRDVRIVAAPEALPGAAIAIRGGLFELDGPRAAPLAMPATARLRDGSGVVVAEAPLAAGAAGGFEGHVRIPEGTTGTHELEVCAGETDAPTCGRRRVQVGLAAATLPVAPRLQTEAQRLHAGSLEVLRPEAAALELRVPGGACQPEFPCPVLVLMEPPGLRLGVERSGVVRAAEVECALVDPDAEDAPLPASATATDGPHRCALALADAQGVVHLSAHDAAGVVARRTVQLPVALGMPRLDVDAPIVRVGEELAFTSRRLLPEQPLALDVFREGHWVRALSLPGRDADAFALRFEAPGLHRVFARTSASGGTMAMRTVLVLARGGDAQATVAALAEGETAARPWSAEARARWAFARTEDQVVQLPPGTSSAAQLRLGRAGAASARRNAAAALILLAGALVAFIVLRRGLAADAEARAILAEAEVPGASSAGRRGAMTRRTWTVAGLTFLGFALAAAALLSRGCV
ncbi:MAG: hypothetical protein AAGH15_12240 [Myxococcota bacterium]